MCKMKTNSSCKKRFRKNSAGKVKTSRAFKRHHAWAKSKKQKRELRTGMYMEGTFAKKIASAMPY